MILLFHSTFPPWIFHDYTAEVEIFSEQHVALVVELWFVHMVVLRA